MQVCVCEWHALEVCACAYTALPCSSLVSNCVGYRRNGDLRMKESRTWFVKWKSFLSFRRHRSVLLSRLRVMIPLHWQTISCCDPCLSSLGFSQRVEWPMPVKRRGMWDKLWRPVKTCCYLPSNWKSKRSKLVVNGRFKSTRHSTRTILNSFSSGLSLRRVVVTFNRWMVRFKAFVLLPNCKIPKIGCVRRKELNLFMQ